MPPFSMRVFLFSILFSSIMTHACAQAYPGSPGDTLRLERQGSGKRIKSATTSFLRMQAEQCGNNQDDDNNGLADCNDFHCYFSDPICECQQSNLIWVNGGNRLVWYDISTGIDHLAATLPVYMGDITWTSDGKLYGSDIIYSKIYEINPNTGDTLFIRNIPGGYDYTNGMTADYSGNLYLTARTISTQQWHVIKLNLTTGNISIIANLSNAGLISSGDVTFMNGSIYVACENFKLAKVNRLTGAIQVSTINTPLGYIFGLVSVGNRDLYFGSADKLYRLDTLTMQATLIHTFISNYLYVQGMSNYQEPCQTYCRPLLRIDTISTAPFCSGPGVLLKAIGSGVTGTSVYEWILPDGSRMPGDTLRINQSGVYKVKYYSIIDSCGKEDSVNFELISNPVSFLGNDTLICPSGQLILQNRNNSNVSYFLWQDGSTQNQLSVTAPGMYWLQVSNVCGTSRDSVLVAPAQLPVVNLGLDTLLCPGDRLVLKNKLAKNNYDRYRWSDGSSNDSLTISSSGIYWLQSSNLCETAADTIRITMKDSCRCNPVIPVASLGIDKEICLDDTLVLSNLSHRDGFRYMWQSSVGGNSFVVRQPGTYWVNVSNYCGSDSDTIIISEKLIDCVCNIQIPTAFTPNSDGLNDELKVISNCLVMGEIFIYNRWGELVYRSRNFDQGWNGVYKGSLQYSGVYIYQVKYSFLRSPGQRIRKGSFVLIR
jgi:gliding motility-associated-like protein